MLEWALGPDSHHERVGMEVKSATGCLELAREWMKPTRRASCLTKWVAGGHVPGYGRTCMILRPFP